MRERGEESGVELNGLYEEDGEIEILIKIRERKEYLEQGSRQYIGVEKTETIEDDKGPLEMSCTQ